VPPLTGAAGALWYAVSALPVAAGFNTSFRFVLSAPAQRCADVRQARAALAAAAQRTLPSA
jgi:hypothetical protein